MAAAVVVLPTPPEPQQTMIRRSPMRADSPFTTMCPCRRRHVRALGYPAAMVAAAPAGAAGRFAKVDQPGLHGIDEQIDLGEADLRREQVG